MKKSEYLFIALIAVVVFATLYVYLPKAVEAQLRYNLDEPVLHVKFFVSTDINDLSFQINKFIVNKTFESRVFEIQTIELVDVSTDGLLGITTYTVMITYLDLNEESPDRALADLEDRIARAQLEGLPTE